MSPLIAYRREHQLSRSQLAKKLGCSESFIGHIERGVRRLSWEKAMEWEAKLGVPREALCPHIFGNRTVRQGAAA